MKIVVEVTDSGGGMSLDGQPHLFDAIWQKDATSTLSDGTGLGLPIARQLARLLGGDVTLVKSAEDAGSTFVVSLALHYLPVPEAN